MFPEALCKGGVVVAGICLVGIILSQPLECLEGKEKEIHPIRLHPENGHYFLWRGRPAILITSGEHYGAVLNRDFDYTKYLRTLEKHRFNLTRIFSGAYCEKEGDFRIKGNTLAPKKGRFLCPWARSNKPGYTNGGNKFDLNKWDPAYFARLRDFVAEAGKRGVVVEVVMFCTFYGDTMWKRSPLNTINNINGIGSIGRSEVFTLRDKKLTAVQEAMVRKIVMELKDFDNVYYEICNEPYERGGQSREWQRRMARTIVETEKNFGVRHLIAQGLPWRKSNLPKNGKRIEPIKEASVLNFHGSRCPEVFEDYYDLNKVLALDETGGRSDISLYRKMAWKFILSGGAVFDHLDFSFGVGHEDGTQPLQAPGGGGAELRKQLEVLREFIYGINFIRMRPDHSVIQKIEPEGITIRALVERGRAYAIYLHGGEKAHLVIELPKGWYKAEWVNTQTGEMVKREIFHHSGRQKKLVSPVYTDDIALRILGK